MSEETTTGLVIKKDVKTELTPARRAELGAEIAAHTLRYDELEAAKKEVGSEYTAKMKAEKSDALRKSKALRSGVLEEQVECVEVQDFARNAVRFQRIDTGAIVGERPMEQGERQLSIDGVDEKKTVAPVVAIDRAKKKTRLRAEGDATTPTDEEKH